MITHTKLFRRRALIVLVSAAAALLPAQLASQTDDVLISIPAGQYNQASHSVLSGLRVYQRLPGFFLAGADRQAVRQLTKARLEVVILDDQPWTDHYAVVGTHPGYKGFRSYDGLVGKVLYASPDFDLVKAPRSSFEQLRARGFTCVEIERQEIAVEAHSTYLPQSVLDRPNDWIADVIANVSDSTVRTGIQRLQDFGTRYFTNANRDTVARWVMGKYREYGLTDAVLDSFQYASGWQKNVVATIPGDVTPTAELIVGGHHDSYSTPVSQAPGADDNATGAVAALEMARVLKLINYQPAYTMRFMGFAAEEAGLVGSNSYATRARNANRDIRAMENYDMIGNRSQAPTDPSVYVVWYTGAEALSNLNAAMMRMYTGLTPVLTTSYRSGSDSYSFWQRNYSSTFCIEKNFSPYYHSPNDLIQYLDIGFASSIIRSGLAMLLTLDMMPASVTGLQVRDCGNGTSLYASWDSVLVPDWYRYKVYIGTSPGVYTSNTLAATRWTRLDGLDTGARYYVGVSIVDLAGREGMITELSGVPRIIPEAPTGVWLFVGQHGGEINWRRNLEMDVQGYNIYRKTDSATGFVRLNIQPSPDTLWVDSLGTGAQRFYYVTAVDSAGHESAPSDTVLMSIISVDEPSSVPSSFRLEQNYPNPFNPATTIKYSLSPWERVSEGRVRVTIKVYDVLGREVTTLVNETKSPGRYNVVWNAAGVASGVYFYKLESNGRVEMKRMILMK